MSRAGRREGIWRYSVNGEERFLVRFFDDQPMQPPSAWLDSDWPRPSLEGHRQQRELLEIVLREYRSPDDVGRIYELLLPRAGDSNPIVRALMNALGVALSDAKMALDDACDRARRVGSR